MGRGNSNEIESRKRRDKWEEYIDVPLELQQGVGHDLSFQCGSKAVTFLSYGKQWQCSIYFSRP
jgi:hypothetical protein